MLPAAVIRSLLVFDEKHPLYLPYKVAKRIAIGIVGGSVLIVGVCMIVLPGPAFVVIPAGLAILGLEFAWARSWLKKVKAKSQEVARGISSRMSRTTPDVPGAPPAPPRDPPAS
jgi:uncharacterized protein (TIGR02611 family)